MCCVDLLLNTDKFREIEYYRPPHYTSADEVYLDWSLRCFTSLMSNATSRVVLIGGFNLPNVDWIHYSASASPFYDMFIRFVNENGLLQFVSEPTRHENILDLYLTNVPNLISDLQVQCPLSTSDHNIVKFSINLSSDHNNVSDNHGVDEWYYDFSCGDYEAMESYLMNVN